MLSRASILYILVAVAFMVLAVRLFYIQVVDPQYERSANNNVLRHEVLYPARGEVYDRNGEFLVQNREVYDLMVTPRDVKPFDTLMMCSIIGVTKEQLVTAMDRARRFSTRRASVAFEMLPKEAKLKIEERGFPGFHTVYRTIRSYPRNVGGNLLGYVGKVRPIDMERDEFYRATDYIGLSGVERAYERVLRGEKGVRISLVDVHGIVQGSYADGAFDTLPVPGTAITTTIDLRLQLLAEELLAGKVGSVVAIEPATGEILVMASSPTYDPNDMVGREIGRNFVRLRDNPRAPLLNRAVQSHYPPGSTFKMVNALIALEEGVLTPTRRYECHGSYTVGRSNVRCRPHYSPVDLNYAIQTSCNTYFCIVFRNILDNRRYANVKEGFATWAAHVGSFGFGRRLGSDFLDERAGNLPSVAGYDREYRGQWNSMTVLTLAIGQDKMEASPLQLANFTAILANRGFYHIPHIVRRIHDRDSIDARFYERHYPTIDPRHYEPVIEGMWRMVNESGGTAYSYRLPGLDMCGKTGTAENPRGKDHSTFVCFAPRHSPQIAVSVYIEHGGFGSALAMPIASLLVEQYLTGKVEREWMVDMVKNTPIPYPVYDNRRQ
ncbi:MAG: penicillin-binding protein 2 [Rikenellaceae bacterium]|nr:penicillin-binding protein 2 [Rikenellaceae bacterium]MCL2692183.1 penicillin-binding protein 2 [Rikenellaceae bacterium]